MDFADTKGVDRIETAAVRCQRFWLPRGETADLSRGVSWSIIAPPFINWQARRSTKMSFHNKVSTPEWLSIDRGIATLA